MQNFAGWLLAVAWLQCLACGLCADDATTPPQSLQLEPAEITLLGPRAEQRLLLTARFGEADLRDLTDTAGTKPTDPSPVALTSSDPSVVRVEGAIVRPVANGKATITATHQGQTASVPVTVTGMDRTFPISFHTEVLAALTQAGCNMGACHGSPSGKGGFRLSLRGYDPPLDILTLRSEFSGRRTNVVDPDDSLLLKKPLMQVSHGGGKRFQKGDAAHAVLRQWIAEGMQLDPPGAATLARIEVLPDRRVLRPGADRQQLIVQGHFSDGSIRDVTALTVFSSSTESVATVSPSGLVERHRRGETAVLARYLDKMDTAEFTFLEEIPGFEWKSTPEFNVIDALVNAKLQRLQIPPADLCSDDEFLRRAYLDVAGRLPTLEDTREFLGDLSADKRARLIDRLLESPDYAAFWGLKWSDVLRVSSGSLKPAGVAKFNRWIVESAAADQPMDEFARELLTARGSVFENPAASYWRTCRDPLDATETTAQLFLGVRIQCAKCHNHPFERWTQDNYYGIGAAFARVGRKKSAAGDDEIIFDKDSGEVTQPRTGATMKVHLLLHGDVDVPAEQDRRQVFADWLTSPENPFFARSLVNRVWGHLTGRGIVDPVDDFRDSNPPSNPELLDELARQFIANGCSRKWLIRTVMNCHTYQRSARTSDLNADDERYFSHRAVRLLSAEQLLDAVCGVTGVPEKFAGMPAGSRATQLAEPPTDNYFLKVFGQPQRQMACECERSSDSNLSQALQMINGPTVHNKLRDDRGRIKRLLDEGKSNEEIIRELYLAAVCREPSSEELSAALAHLSSAENRRWALEDIGWAVLNTKEFLFQH